MPYPNQIPNSSLDTSPVSTIVVVVSLLLVIAAGAAVIIIALRIRARTRARIAAMSPAERERLDAVTEYQARITQAEKALATETKLRATRLKHAEKALDTAHSVGIRAVATYRGKDGSAHITGTDIQTDQGTFLLTASVNATVDTAGNLATSSRSTLTRVAAGGLLFGPVGAIVGGVAKKTKMHDSRELYLLIEGEAFATLINCNPDDGAKVRQFATTVKQAALQADHVRAQRASAVKAAEQALAAEQQNTAPVVAARASLQQAIADTTCTDAATRALEA